MKKIIIVGGGFAGLWSAVAAVRRLEEIHETAQVILVNATPFHSIRVRNYEMDLSDTRIDLRDILDPIGVDLVIGHVLSIDTGGRQLRIDQNGEITQLEYDKIILASGSRLAWPDVQGLREHGFDIDTYDSATRLHQHLDGLAALDPSPGQFTALVIGAGATGVELAAELPQRLSHIAGGHGSQARVILADRADRIASGLGGGRPVIEKACNDLGIETRVSIDIVKVDEHGVELADGSRIDAATVIWCGGMIADELTGQIGGSRDDRGRLHVDSAMAVIGVPDVFAAGDVAHAVIDGERPSVMSCQHARPMGRYAGANAVNALFGKAASPLHIDWYTNIIDLGEWGAVYTQGWNRDVVAIGTRAKDTKTTINRVRIYPPRDGERDTILAGGTLDLERPPMLKTLEKDEIQVRAIEAVS